MPLSFGASPWLLVLCALGAAALTYWTYRRTVPVLSTGRRAVLGALRFLALFIVLFLLFEPIWSHIARDERPPILAVLIDDSQSLSLQIEQEGDSLDLEAGVRETIARLPLGEIGGRTRFFAFSSDVRPLAEGSAVADSLHFQGARTDISRALERLREELRHENVRGILLISDGQYNTGRNPLYVAERYPVPIHTVAVGDTTRRRDLQVRRVTTNEIAYVDAELPVQVGLRAEGFENEQVVVSLFGPGGLVGSTTVRLPGGTAEVPADLSFTPKEEGLHRLRVTVTQLPGEVTYRNNSETITVRVLRNKQRVLLLAAAPNPDVATVRQLLQDDETEVVSFVQKAPGAFYEGAFPASLDAFDIVVLVGYPGRAADRAVMQRIAQAGAAGTPLFFFLTQQTDLAALRQHFAGVLPAVPARSRPGFTEASFVATPGGQQHPVLEMPDVEPAQRRLPPLLYNQSQWQVSPDARVLATVEMRGVRLDEPLLVVRQRGRNRSAALLGSGTWRWKNLPEDLAASASFWPTLFSNLTQWLAAPENDRRVRVEPVQDLFGGGERVQFTGQVYDESLNPVADASVTVEVTAADGTTYPYTMDPVDNGRYVLDAGSFPEGTYRYHAEAARGGTALGTDDGSFAVGALSLEFKETRADAALLRQIAQRSGGTFFMPDEAAGLPEALNASTAFQPVVFEEAQETELRQLPFFLAVIVSLLTIEWLLRKRSGMA